MKAIRKCGLILLTLLATVLQGKTQALHSIYLFVPQSLNFMSLIDSFEYDTQGRLNKRLSFLVNPNGLAIPAAYTNYTYNTGNQIVSELSFQRSPTNTWDTSHRYDYVYNTHGRVVLKEEWFAPLGWGGGPLTLTAMVYFKHNAQGKLDSTIKKTLFNGLWRDYFIIKHLYNADGFLIHEVETRRKTNDPLQLFEEKMYTYDVQDRLSSMRIEKSHGLNAPFPSEIVEETYFYTGHSLLVDSIHQVVDDRGRLRQSLTINYRRPNDSLSEVRVFGGAPGNWSLIERLQYNYALGTSVSPLSTLELKVYPNPFTNVLHIYTPADEPAQGQVFDLQGRLLSAFEVQAGSAELQLGHLPAGMYLVHVQSRHKSRVERLLKF